MTLQFDARGLKCPLLFVKTKQRLKRLLPHQQLVVLVDDYVGSEDIRRYLQKQAFEFTITMIAGDAVSNTQQSLQFCINAKTTANKPSKEH